MKTSFPLRRTALKAFLDFRSENTAEIENCEN